MLRVWRKIFFSRESGGLEKSLCAILEMWKGRNILTIATNFQTPFSTLCHSPSSRVVSRWEEKLVLGEIRSRISWKYQWWRWWFAGDTLCFVYRRLHPIYRFSSWWDMWKSDTNRLSIPSSHRAQFSRKRFFFLCYKFHGAPAPEKKYLPKPQMKPPREFSIDFP